MGRKCTICSRKDLADINQAMVAGEPLRQIAERCGTSAQTLIRHRGHIPEHLAKAQEAAEVADADSLLTQVTRQRDRAERLAGAAETILTQAVDAKEAKTALEAIRTACAAVKEVRGCLELLGKVTQELVERSEVTIESLPDLSAVPDELLQIIATGSKAAVERAMADARKFYRPRAS